jgi:tetratricopeptide (TPR) repeat protein
MSKYLQGEEVPQIKADFDRCAQLFELALTLNPSDPNFDNSRALFCKGRASVFAHQYDEGQRLLDESIRLDSTRAYAYNALGIAYLERISRSGSGFQEAEAAFQSAMRFAPYWAYPVHNLALLRSERGDYDGAIRLYQFAMSIAPRFSYLPYNLGLLYQRLGDFENARIWFTRARDVLEKYREGKAATWPGRSQVWNALGALASAQHRDGKAREFFEKSLADDPENQNARHNLAQLLARQGDTAKADALWLRNITAAPDFIPSRVAYAESLTARDSIPAAIEQYEQILARQPAYAGGREALARLYLQQGQLERALAQLEQAIASSSSTPTLLELQGDVNMRLGNKAAAIADWNKARDATINNGAARKRLDRKMEAARGTQP